jgi:hypothetical protein
MFSMRILVRIGPLHSLASSKSDTILWGSPLDETRKTEVPCHSRCDTIKISPCSKALSAEHRPKFYSLSPVMVMTVTSPYKLKILRLECDVKQ